MLYLLGRDLWRGEEGFRSDGKNPGKSHSRGLVVSGVIRDPPSIRLNERDRLFHPSAGAGSLHGRCGGRDGQGQPAFSRSPGVEEVIECGVEWFPGSPAPGLYPFDH